MELPVPVFDAQTSFALASHNSGYKDIDLLQSPSFPSVVKLIMQCLLHRRLHLYTFQKLALDVFQSHKVTHSCLLGKPQDGFKMAQRFEKGRPSQTISVQVYRGRQVFSQYCN